MKNPAGLLFFLLIFFSTNYIIYAQNCTPASVAAGSPDSCFGTNGMVKTPLGINPIAYDVAVQPDGKIVVVGASDYAAPTDFAVIRYHADGSLDASFDGDGKTTTDFWGYDEPKSVALQPDGKIVVGGRSSQSFAIARYNPDGSLDTTFSGGGKVLTDVGSLTTDVQSVLTIQTNGKLLLAGFRVVSPNLTRAALVVRYNAGGSLDMTFDGDGKAEIAGMNEVYAVAEQADGKILVGGTANSRFAVARLNADGSPDASFGTNGVAIYSEADSYGTARALAVEANGKIVAAGSRRLFLNGGISAGVMVRFSAAGAVESSYAAPQQVPSVIHDVFIQPDGKILTAGFNQDAAARGFEIMRFSDVGIFDETFNGGILRLNFTDGNPENGLSYAFALTMDRNKKIVATGVTQQNMNVFGSKIAVTRVMSGLETGDCTPVRTAAGSLDTCFGTAGKVTTKLGAGLDWGRGVALQADGKIVAVGAADQTGASDFGVVRYNADGSLDDTFDGDGKLVTDFEGRADVAMDVRIQPDGKIVVAGASSGYFAVARYHADGSADNSFDADGKVLTDIGAPPVLLFNSLEIQPDGKIVVAGGGGSFTPTGLKVVRYNTDGALDNTFGGDGIVSVDAVGYGKGIVVQPDGKILTAGSLGLKLAVARLNADGSPDVSFGNNGLAVFTNGERFDEAFTLALERNGKILAGGSSRASQNGLPCGLFVRFDAGGAVASSFINCNNSFSSLYIQPDGKILTAGFDDDNPANGFQIMRYNDLGVLDSTFNGSGIVQIGFPDTQGIATAYAVTMQRDNKIVAVGMTETEATQNPPGKFAVVRIMSGLVAPRRVPFDFDGDGQSDVSVFRPATGIWYVFQSSNNVASARAFGLSTDLPTPGDYDGDGKTDLSVFRPSTGDWWTLSSRTGTFTTVHWGAAGDVPRPADFDGDDKADFVVYRPSTGVWYRYGSTGAVAIDYFGTTGDHPLSADFDGDGKSDLAIFRPATGAWWWKSSLSGTVHAVNWGISTDKPVPADYDGDGKTDLAVYRDGAWYVLKSSDGQAAIYNFGRDGDQPAPADYDGDGRTDIAVFRPSDGVWYLNRSTAGFTALAFGISTDIALPNAFVP